MLHERLRNHRIVARLEPPRTVAALPVGPTADREARYERDRDDDREPGEHRGDDAVREAHTPPLRPVLGHAATAALSPGLRVHLDVFPMSDRAKAQEQIPKFAQPTSTGSR